MALARAAVISRNGDDYTEADLVEAVDMLK